MTSPTRSKAINDASVHCREASRTVSDTDPPIAGMKRASLNAGRQRRRLGCVGLERCEAWPLAEYVLLALDELKKVGVYFAGVDDRNSVGASGIHFQDRVRNDFWHSLAGRRYRHDLVVFTVDHEQRDVALGYVVGVVNLPAVGRVVLSPGASQQTLKPKQVTHALGGSGTRSVRAEERLGQALEERRAIVCHSGADTVNHRNGRAVRVGVALRHVGNNRVLKDHLGEPRSAVS